MAHPVPGRARALALPVGLALTASLGVLPAEVAAAVAADGPDLSYVVNTRVGRRSVERVRGAVERAGGTVVIAYDRIGVVVVRSKNPDFAGTIRRVRGVRSAGATRTRPIVPRATTDIGVDVPLTAAQERAAAARAAADQDPMEPLQWDLLAIRADEAHRRTPGSASVTVAVIDTGVDDTHPDLAPNFDRASSANCVSGAPDTTPGAWRPKPGESDHGTHVAGTVAAAKNGVGITGVAPGVKVSGIKVGDPDGFFYTEAVVCGFVWAADHGADVTNNSYFTDPWLYTCADDPDQGALVEAVHRAARYAERRGVVNVASAGNASDDLSADTLTDATSPDDGTPADRTVDPGRCPDIPAMLPGVVTVSATGAKGLKASYSNYGNGVVDVAAPGGDATAYQQPDAPATSGLILSTLPGGRYGYKAGTSMAAPHVAGVVALIRSKHPYASPAGVKALLTLGADAKACGAPYDIDGDDAVDAVCEGDERRNGFYGAGTVDALDAVRR
ncbi:MULTISPECIES: S8 family peptidase [unclassified Streptomyces]|uniref:S8 family peptidase n=1 Tax=unclassified Streptomyces TaxID=2593676 RepID=UPI000DAB5422|nr:MULTISPECIES: S8 family serine peptidase [unclassified Streptomyces]PZT74380.1 peptidase S8 [Streptomyces sp. AC1-42T]PZT82630.1 peptidase S8 [Streptomyces sp. AC1-42W]